MASLRYFFSSLTAGVLAGVGILVAPLWWCASLGLGLFIYLSWTAPSLKKTLVSSIIFGGMSAGAGLLSLWEIVPPGSEQSLSTFIAAGILWWLPTLALGVVSVLYGAFLYISRIQPLAPVWALLGWLIHEELRAVAWMVLTFGRGAVPEPHLSIAALGYALADSPYLLQLAEGGGLLFLSAATALFATTIALGLRSLTTPQQRKVALGAAALSLIVILLPLGTSPSPTPVPETYLKTVVLSSTVGLSSPYIPSPTLSTLFATSAPDLLIFPEGKDLRTVLQDDELYASIVNLWFRPDTEILTIRSLEETDATGTRYNTLFYESSLRGVLDRSHKRFLMPEGEYLPFLSKHLLSLLPNSTIQTIRTEQSVVYGEGLTTLEYKGASLGALICSEIFSPWRYNALSEHGATTLINIADPAWFQGSSLLFAKTLQVAKVHAVQNRAYFLAANNAMPSFIVAPSGEVVSQTAWGETGALFFNLPTP